ncbi:MAG TPA: haloacid dehalogenase type II [Rhodopila sp.]|nr:haloacid dehalogenase type II [Rhodopila sp.]
MKLSDFQVLTFDCYGTLIDWETGLYTAFQPLLRRLGTPVPRDAVLEAFARRESRQQALTPAMPYAALLAEVHRQLAEEWGAAPDLREDERFGASIGAWPPFPDTVEALRYLKQHFRLVILSNVDRAGFAATNRKLGEVFDAVHTAQDIGSYKPDLRNFTYLLDRLQEAGFRKSQVLHVAQSLFHDHAPANAVGLASAWIDRRGDAGGSGATAPVAGDVRYDFRFPTLGALAEAHRAGG